MAFWDKDYYLLSKYMYLPTHSNKIITEFIILVNT